MTLTITDAKSLYEVSSDLRALIQVWVDERRCPLPLVDLLLEVGLESAAEAARWAATKEDRTVYWPLEENGERGGCCGPYPSLIWDHTTSPVVSKWQWGMEGDHADDLPDSSVPVLGDLEAFVYVEDALLWLLDNWTGKLNPSSGP